MVTLKKYSNPSSSSDFMFEKQNRSGQQPSRFSLPASFIFFFLCVFVTLFIYSYINLSKPLTSSFRISSQTYTPIITLTYNSSKDDRTILNNCLQVSRYTPYDFQIYTDDTNKPFCDVCNCIRFEPVQCKCNYPGKFECKYCEKLHFMTKMFKTFKQIIFIDSDNAIINPNFIDILLERSKHFDFLATYGFSHPATWNYRADFNSGLMFVRTLSTIDYNKLPPLMWELKVDNDQHIISRFIFKYYENWDTLSLRWHCRYLYRKYNNIDPKYCFTFHARGHELEGLLKESNRTLLTM